jgi:hypothetical protein
MAQQGITTNIVHFEISTFAVLDSLELNESKAKTLARLEIANYLNNKRH